MELRGGVDTATTGTCLRWRPAQVPTRNSTVGWAPRRSRKGNRRPLRRGERVSGRPLGTLMQQRIFGPLGMTRTTFDPPTSGAQMATGYRSWALADPTPAQPEGKGWTGAAGAIWSTPTDLLAWDLALVSGKAIGPNAHRALTTWTAP